MTDHKAAKEFANHLLKDGYCLQRPIHLASCYLELTEQLAAKDAVIGELAEALWPFASIHDKAVFTQELITGKNSVINARATLAKHRESADKGEQMNKKYLVIADYVTSKNDGDRHFINCHQLMRLYSVNPDDCICLDSGDKSVPPVSWYKERNPSLIELRPKFNGNYSMPSSEKKEPHWFECNYD